MRHDQALASDNYKAEVIPAVWPATVTFGSMPVIAIERAANDRYFEPTPAAPDVPASVGKLIFASYAALIAAFAIATARSADSIFMISISAFFVAIFFAVPRIFFAVESQDRGRPSFQRFLREGMQTYTGHSSGVAALVQMLIVPLFLTAAILAMGLAASIIM